MYRLMLGLAVAAVVALAGSGAGAERPDELAATPTERGALLAWPSVYTLVATFEAAPNPRAETSEGLAFAVGPGVLVTAAHLVTRSQDPEGRAPEIRLRPGAAPARPQGPALLARVVRADDATGLAILRTREIPMPGLRLAGGSPSGTAVTAFRTTHGGEPIPLSGRLGATQVFPRAAGRALTRLSVPVEPGMGGPVVDGSGRVRAVVVGRRPSVGVPVDAVRRLVEESNLPMGEGSAAGLFRAGMTALWRLDPSGAETNMEAALRAFPGHALAPDALGVARSLEQGEWGVPAPDTERGLLLAVGAASGALALGFALALAAGVPSRRMPQPHTDEDDEPDPT